MKNEILVIDDNFDIRNLISNILKDKNYNVREAANYDQAAFEIDKQLPDLAVIDVKLDKGDKDGIDLLKNGLSLVIFFTYFFNIFCSFPRAFVIKISIILFQLHRLIDNFFFILIITNLFMSC